MQFAGVLCAATTRRWRPTSPLEKLWKQAEAIARQLPARIAEADLKHLIKYTGEFLYPAQGARKLDARSVRERLEGPITEFVAYAERRVPELVKDTLSRIE